MPNIQEQPAAGQEITVEREVNVIVNTPHLVLKKYVDPGNRNRPPQEFVTIKTRPNTRINDEDPYFESTMDMRMYDEVINGLMRYKSAIDEAE